MKNGLIFLSPIKKLMANMRLKNKCFTIIMVIVIGYIPSIYFIYNSLHSVNQVAQDELIGVDYLKASQEGLYQLTSGSVDNATNTVQKTIESISALSQNDGDTLGVNPVLEKMGVILSEVKNTDNSSFKDNVLPILNTFKTLFDTIITNSQLALDPDTDSYFVMDAVTVQMPLLLSEYTELYALEKSRTANINTAETLNTEQPSGKHNLSLEQTVLSYRMIERIEGIKSDLSKSAAANPALKSYASNVSTNLDKIKRNINDILAGNKTMNQDVLNSTQAILNTLITKGFNQLSMLLNQRVEGVTHSSIIIGFFWFFSLVTIIYFLIGFIESIKESMAILTASIKLIASGNLVSSVNITGKDEFSDVLHSLSDMQKGLYNIVDQINDVSGTLNCSAHEIASGNNELSERTQDQASCLVETSSSLNNLTETIRLNAGSAREAAELSNEATHIAQKGGEAVNQVIATMGDINESAQKIQEITSVIDGIAFQTNLLALNASVEAARAGEQGRGFAVVASEVRNLAQRAAEAAKQIKGLISDSMSKVASGDAQVKVTFNTMKDIVSSIENVNSIIGKISVASNEQSMSIEQINIVISQLEGNTQKNAAQVEEVAASAELLKDQSSKLVTIVNRFEVDKNNAIDVDSLISSKPGAPQTKTGSASKSPASNKDSSPVYGANDGMEPVGDGLWKEF